MRYQFRVVTSERRLYVTATNTNAVRATLARNGLMPGERVVSITAYANERRDYVVQEAAA